MNDHALEMAVFTNLLEKWAAGGSPQLLAPGKLVTRKMMLSDVPVKKIKDTDFEDEPSGGTASRTSRHPAFD